LVTLYLPNGLMGVIKKIFIILKNRRKTQIG